MPTVRPNGKRDRDNFPTAMLRKERSAFYVQQATMDGLAGRQKWPMFGLNVFHTPAASKQVLRVGDRVEVLEFATKGLVFDNEGD